ncbi:MAG: efflux RND transporter periplasmic adaptor subunit, partial [Anaerolineae bacterium]|nr:efflux RND transporter periplasmic adaptor subunit [Phycisphaerae bacterium]
MSSQVSRRFGQAMWVLATVAASFLPIGCRKPAPQAGAHPPPRVAVAEAIAKDVPLYIEEIGKAVAVEKVSMQPQASGQIIEIHFVDGADVRKGD